MHELDSELVDYLLGTLDRPDRVRVEAALASSADYRRELEALKETFGQIGAVAQPLQPSAALRERVLGVAQPESRFDGFVDRLAALFELEVNAIREILRQASAAPEAPWRAAELAGLFYLPVPTKRASSGVQTALVYLEPGINLPRHRHRGREQMFVLEGYAMADDGRQLAPGDRVDSPPGSEHEIEILEHMPCLFAIVLEEGLDYLPPASRSAPSPGA